jgi:branched-chain amino acid transport system permease protein
VDTFLRLTIFGLATGSIYAVASSGLVLTYATSGIFNFAHGAIAMMGAFMYWELRFNRGFPTPVALVLVLFVFGPLMGVFIERLLIRRLRGASLAATLVATVGLLAALIGISQAVWEPTTRVIRPFFDPEGFWIADVFVSWHRLIILVTAVVVAIGLWVLLHRTRVGIGMRALVDDPDLLALSGMGPARASTLSWAIGASLATLAGVLISALLSLDAILLTLLVINAYAAAVVGRLRSIPLTFAGAMLLGLLQSYAVQYLPKLFAGDVFPDWLTGVYDGIPVLVLFAALLLLPHARLSETSLVRRLTPVKVPTLRTSLIAGAVLVLVAFVVSGQLSDFDLNRVGTGVALGIIVLSVVPLTGYGGQVALCQLTFAGIGAVCVYKFGEGGAALGWMLAIVIPGAVGALIALPALRLQGLYLALSTLAFAVLVDKMVFPTENFFYIGTTTVDRLDVPLISLESRRAWFVLLAVVYAGLAVLVLSLRRGPFGRQLVASRDSPAACATLGLDLTRTKFLVFSLSAAMAGLGGALLAGLKIGITAENFSMSAGLSILLLAVIGGIETTSGPLLAGLVFAGSEVIAEDYPALEWLPTTGIAVIAIALAFHPDGVFIESARRIGRLVRPRPATPATPVRLSLGWHEASGPVVDAPLGVVPTAGRLGQHKREEVAPGGAPRG